MEYNKLAEILFPHISKTPREYEEMYPERDLKFKDVSAL